MTEDQGWTLIGAVFMLLASNLKDEANAIAAVVAVLASVMIIYGTISWIRKNGRGR